MIDTRDKRASALHLPLPTPDGLTLNQGDRQQAAWHYRGISAEVATEVALLTFGLAQRHATFATATRGATFTLSQRQASFVLEGGGSTGV